MNASRDAGVVTPYWSSTEGDVVLHLGDCLDVMRGMPDCSVDAVVTDPPAAVSFMGREWDSDRGGRDKWVAWLAERLETAARCLKPGGHLLVWSLPRTSHWTALALEDAGLEIRDCLVHLFGSGFPKSLDVSRAIDKAAGVEREVIAEGAPVRRMIPGADQNRTGSWIKDNGREFTPAQTAPATGDAARWEGWGTALKPGQEMWWLARKPPSAGNVAANVLAYGTGAINVDACRVAHVSEADRAESEGKNRHSDFGDAPRDKSATSMDIRHRTHGGNYDGSAGRWPANILLTHAAACEMTGTREVRGNIRLNPTVQAARANVAKGAEQERQRGARGYGNLDGTETVEAWDCAPDCPVAELDRQSGVLTSGVPAVRRLSGSDAEGNTSAAYGAESRPAGSQMVGYGDTGGASRFFPVFKYAAKAPASERPRLPDGTAHPTVKPLSLLRWLVRLVTPPGGTVLDLFAGTGTTAEACVIEGFRCVLIEQDPANAELAKVRLSKPIQPDLFGGAA